MPDYDIIIIGAGIHGAAIARAAIYDGYKICVIEQYSAAGLATSSHSSKLIHGGLRYLESYQFKLVKECLKERAILLKTAPSLVRLIPFYIPVYKYNSRPSWLIHLGLFLYRLLGGGKIKKLKKSEWKKLDGLDTDQLVNVFQYHDGITNDKKLTQAILQSAIDHGADFKIKNKLSKIDITNDHVSITLENNQNYSANLLINASGPWVNKVLSITNPPQKELAIDLIQGTHIIIPRKLSDNIFYVEAADKRVIFTIPWNEHCLIGTTETSFNDNPENTQPQPNETEYLLKTWNHYFNDNLKPEEILESFSGLRVLPKSEDDAFKRSRDTILHTDNKDNPHIISIYGGKLTAHRATAEAIMKIVHRKLPGYRKTDTSERTL